LVFDQAISKRCHVVERCINRLKQRRGLAICDEQRAVDKQAMVVIASIALWLPS
jgi:transposase